MLMNKYSKCIILCAFYVYMSIVVIKKSFVEYLLLFVITYNHTVISSNEYFINVNHCMELYYE